MERHPGQKFAAKIHCDYTLKVAFKIEIKIFFPKYFKTIIMVEHRKVASLSLKFEDFAKLPAVFKIGL